MIDVVIEVAIEVVIKFVIEVAIAACSLDPLTYGLLCDQAPLESVHVYAQEHTSTKQIE